MLVGTFFATDPLWLFQERREPAQGFIVLLETLKSSFLMWLCLRCL